MSIFAFSTRVLHHHSVLNRGLRTWRPFSPSSQRPNNLSTLLSWSTPPPHALKNIRGEPDPQNRLKAAHIFLLYLTLDCFTEQILALNWRCHQVCCIREKGEGPDADQLWSGLWSGHAALPSVSSLNEQPSAENQCPNSKTQHGRKTSTVNIFVIKFSFLLFFFFCFHIILFRNCTSCLWQTRLIFHTPESTTINTWWLIK